MDSQFKGKMNEFTRKESYKFGDLTKEIVRRVLSGEYTLDDLFLLLKALALVEASISPVGKFLLFTVFDPAICTGDVATMLCLCCSTRYGIKLEFHFHLITLNFQLQNVC